MDIRKAFILNNGHLKLINFIKNNYKTFMLSLEIAEPKVFFYLYILYNLIKV